MRKSIHLLCAIVSSAPLYAQNHYEQFKASYEKKDTSKQRAILAKWEAANLLDAEFYTSSINYYYSISKQQAVSLNSGSGSGKKGLQFFDSTGKVAGYLQPETTYRQESLDKAIAFANEGINKFPDRLDIRFGKCFILKETGNYAAFASELVKTIEYSQINGNNWFWTNNKKEENGKQFLLVSVQNYLRELYETEDDSLLPFMITIGDAAIKYYPGAVEILSTTAVALMLTKQYDKALDYLLHAEQKDPKDFIVLNNIANAYKWKGDKTNAIKYFKLTMKYGDEQARMEAKEQLKKLEK